MLCFGLLLLLKYNIENLYQPYFLFLKNAPVFWGFSPGTERVKVK